MAFWDCGKHWKAIVKQRFGTRRKLVKIPYKTNRIGLLLMPFSQNGPEKHSKSVRFVTIIHWCFTEPENIEKGLVNNVFAHAEK